MKKIIKNLMVSTIIGFFFCTHDVFAQEKNSATLSSISPIISLLLKKKNTMNTHQYSLRIRNSGIYGCPPSAPHPNAGLISYTPHVTISSEKDTSGLEVEFTYTIYDNSGVITASGTLYGTTTPSSIDPDGTITTGIGFPYMLVDMTSRVYKTDIKITTFTGIPLRISRSNTFDCD